MARLIAGNVAVDDGDGFPAHPGAAFGINLNCRQRIALGSADKAFDDGGTFDSEDDFFTRISCVQVDFGHDARLRVLAVEKEAEVVAMGAEYELAGGETGE